MTNADCILIDHLYGEGVANILLGALQSVGEGDLSTYVNPDDSVHFDWQWRDGRRLVLELKPDDVYFTYLSTTCGGDREQQHDTYQTLVSKLPDIFRNAGVKTFMTTPHDEASVTTLISWGGFQPHGGHLIWEL